MRGGSGQSFALLAPGCSLGKGADAVAHPLQEPVTQTVPSGGGDLLKQGGVLIHRLLAFPPFQRAEQAHQAGSGLLIQQGTVGGDALQRSVKIFIHSEIPSLGSSLQIIEI